MLDISLIRENPDVVRDGMTKVGADPAMIDLIVELDTKWRALTAEGEALRADQKRQSDALKKVSAEERDAAIARLREMKERGKQIESESGELRAALDHAMLVTPNMPHPDAPVGPGEEDNVVVREEGERPTFDFEPKPHWDIAPALGIMDFERGVKLSGSRFYVMYADGARLQRALITWMLDVHTREHGYTEVYPPYVVTEKCLVGTGNLPKFADNLYRDHEDDLWLIPTAEVPLTNLYREEILDADELPKYFVAYTPCFRREKMSAGSDVRGIKRGHQFDKVEMVKYCRPEDGDREHAAMLNDAEDIARGLKLPYRIVEMCTGDLSFVACRKFDVEVWAAGCGEWLEVSSVGYFGDFQARRAGIRYRPAPGAKPEFVHTLNGSGLALPRVMIAVLENCQQADGSVVVPEVLRPYMGGQERIERA